MAEDRMAIVVSVLSLEYQTLREEILARSARRYGFLTVAVAVAAFVTGTAAKDGSVPGWAVGVAVVLVGLAAVTWWMGGRYINALSTRLSKIEEVITRELRATHSDLPVDIELGWETLQAQQRTARSRWFPVSWGPVREPSGSIHPASTAND